MAFIADPKALRTYDPERGLELVHAGGGGPGYTSFHICQIKNLEDILGGFWAATKFLPPSPDELLVKPSLKGHYVWVVASPRSPGLPLRGHTWPESNTVIHDALVAYRDVHGNPSDDHYQFDVEFPDFMKRS